MQVKREWNATGMRLTPMRRGGFWPRFLLLDTSLSETNVQAIISPGWTTPALLLRIVDMPPIAKVKYSSVIGPAQGAQFTTEHDNARQSVLTNSVVHRTDAVAADNTSKLIVDFVERTAAGSAGDHGASGLGGDVVAEGRTHAARDGDHAGGARRPLVKMRPVLDRSCLSWGECGCVRIDFHKFVIISHVRLTSDLCNSEAVGHRCVLVCVDECIHDHFSDATDLRVALDTVVFEASVRRTLDRLQLVSRHVV